MKTFRQWVEELSPTWLLDEVGSRLASSIALVGDVLSEHMLEGLFARFLYSDDFPSDALRIMGEERMMPRYAGESDETYKSRLRAAWDAWMFAGTSQAILSQLQAAGYDGYVRENHQWYWDADTADWSRFWIVITDHPFEFWRLGAQPLGSGRRVGEQGLALGTTATLTELQSLRQLAGQWKPAHVRCEYIILVYDELLWDAALPDGTWDDPANRNNSAAYVSA